MALQKDLREFIELLRSNEVEFLVVGGYAVAFHGYPRLTGDIDLFIRNTRENISRIVKTLEQFGFGPVGDIIEDLAQPERMLRLGNEPNRIDILTSIAGVGFEEAWKDRVERT